jgi:hypothetical protein
MCPHTAVYVASYRYICVLILLYLFPHTSTHVSSYCYMYVQILLHMCPHTATYVSNSATYVSSYCYMCLHTAICVSSYCYIRVCILLYMCICVFKPLYVPSYCYIRVCVYVSSYYYIRARILQIRVGDYILYVDGWSCAQRHTTEVLHRFFSLLFFPFSGGRYHLCVSS